MTATKWNTAALNLEDLPLEEFEVGLPGLSLVPIIPKVTGSQAESDEAESPEIENRIVIPETLAILPLRGVVVYPLTAVPLTVGQPRSVKLVDDAAVGQRIIGLVASKNPELETPGPEDLYRVGTAAVVHRLFRAPDGTIRMLVQGLARFQLIEFVSTEPYLRARIQLAPESIETGLEVKALMRNVGE